MSHDQEKGHVSCPASHAHARVTVQARVAVHLHTRGSQNSGKIVG